MINEIILEKAIRKAEKNGFKGNWEDYGFVCEAHTEESGGCCVYTTIFSHSFAKAIFGKWWEICLKEMVLSEEPLRYLKKFLG